MAGSRATEACEPRQVRKEAAVTMSAMCCGKPGHQYIHPFALLCRIHLGENGQDDVSI